MKHSAKTKALLSEIQKRRWAAGVYVNRPNVWDSHRAKLLAGAKKRKSKFGKLYKKHKKIVEHLYGMHARLRDGVVKSVAWPLNEKGLAAFMSYIGPIPKGMRQPSVGRINHKVGYRPGNCFWQERSENSRESMTRWANKYWRNPAHRKRQANFARQSWLNGSLAKRKVHTNA
jgi:hypothetical protein